jgi:hypothetical protein
MISITAVLQILAHMAPAKCAGLSMTALLNAAKFIMLFLVGMCGTALALLLMCYLKL